MAAECVVCSISDSKLLRCGRCNSRVYCSKVYQMSPKCQSEDWPTHKAQCKRQNYILKVVLHPRFITNPCISRTLSCPATATFADLHEALLVAFGWANTHLYEFDVFDHDEVGGSENRLSRRDPIFKIADLNTVDTSFAPPYRSSSKVTLFKVMDDAETKGKTIHYNYDFGDNWEHVITCTGRIEVTPHFICLAGEGHGCAEDIGGVYGWMDLLRAYDAQSPTKEQKENMEWFETSASNKDPEGLRGEKKWRWDKDRINAILGELRGSSGVASGSSSSLPSVLLISLDKQPYFDDTYSEVMAKLRSRATVTQVTHMASAMQHLLRPQKEHAAVIVTDPEVMENDFIAVQEKLVDYARAGGTVIIGFHFTSFAHFDNVDRFFKDRWALKWKIGDYTSSMFSLNPRANPVFMRRRDSNLPQQYSMKALHLSNTKAEDRIYVSDPDSTQSPAVFAKYGNGYLGWIGDVNIEIATTELLLTMCGV